VIGLPNALSGKPHRQPKDGVFFTISVVVVLVWMPTIGLFGSVDTWQLVINTMTSVLAFSAHRAAPELRAAL
jgi:hypothetical protein